MEETIRFIRLLVADLDERKCEFSEITLACLATLDQDEWSEDDKKFLGALGKNLDAFRDGHCYDACDECEHRFLRGEVPAIAGQQTETEDGTTDGRSEESLATA
jgi:hypothetical protein